MNFKEFDYEFDLNGYVVLRNIIDPKILPRSLRYLFLETIKK